jgi:hypothetical protein
MMMDIGAFVINTMTLAGESKTNTRTAWTFATIKEASILCVTLEEASILCVTC